MKKTGPIVFFGSGPVAAESLRLLSKHCDIETVITKPRATHHRGSVPVLTTAEELNIPVVTVGSKQELDNALAASPITSKVGVLIDFGIIVSQQAIDYFPLGIINSHFSILPELRGADPISFAILSGQSSTGVSLMQIVPALDEGPLLCYKELALSDTTDTSELTASLIRLSDTLLRHWLPKYIAGEASLKPQTITGKNVSYTRKLSKQDGIIDWQKPATTLEREIRAFQGWPGSKTKLGEIEVTIEEAHVASGTGKPGTIMTTANSLGVQTAKNILIIDRLKPSGKKSMNPAAFLAGYRHRIT